MFYQSLPGAFLALAFNVRVQYHLALGIGSCFKVFRKIEGQAGKNGSNTNNTSAAKRICIHVK